LSAIQFVPYSLHSNFSELHDFVKSIAPARIVPIVRSRNKQNQIDNDYEENDRSDWKNAYEMASVQQKGLEILEKFKSKLSEEYTTIMHNVEMQKKINELLGFRKSEATRLTLRDKPRESKEMFAGSKKPRKGAQLNVQVDQQ